MVSLLFAGITRPLLKRSVMPKLLTQVICLQCPQAGRILIGIVAGFISEWWPASNRNFWPDEIGIRSA